MPPRVALGGVRSDAFLPPAEHSSQPRVVQFKSKVEAETHNLDMIFNSLNVCFLRMNREHIITDANPTALQFLQGARYEVVGQSFNNVFHGLGASILRDAVKGASFTNCKLQSARHPHRWVDLHIHPDHLGAIVFFKDIIERRLPGRSTSRTSELLQASLNSLSAHVVVLDKTGTIVASNLAWQRFAAANNLAGSPSDRCSASYLSLYDDLPEFGPQAQAIKKGLTSVLSGRRLGMRQVYKWQETGGGALWFELSASRLDCDRETHFVVVNDDVTAIKEAEQALGEAAENLLSLQEEERQRISEELHDSTAQHLVAAGLNLMGLRSRVEARGEVLEFLQRIENSLSEASRELRTLTYLLHPPFLEANGLRETVRRYVEGFGKRTGVTAKLRIGQGVDVLPFVLQRPLFRVIQEALANVYRHASASQVAIDLRCIHQHLHLLVRDNGHGMGGVEHLGQKLSEPACPGVGIPGIRARLRQFGGKLVIKSGPRGTMLHAIVPIAAEAADAAARWQGTGNISEAFGVSADVKKETLQ